MLDLSFLWSRFDWYSAIDIMLVALIFYSILRLIQGTQAVQVLQGILVLSVLMAIGSSFFASLTAFSWLLSNILPAVLVAIPVMFQTELRRALDRLGSSGRWFTFVPPPQDINKTVDAVVNCAVNLSNLHQGGLIVFEQNTGLRDYIETGIRLDAVPSTELLTTVFEPHTPLHDGGVIISKNRIVAAATVFPLGNHSTVGKYMLGTRHRAAIGITQLTDAIAVVVSEETGTISMSYNGELIRGLREEQLRHSLYHFCQPTPVKRSNFLARLFGRTAQG